jgi:hypothetical protein
MGGGKGEVVGDDTMGAVWPGSALRGRRGRERDVGLVVNAQGMIVMGIEDGDSVTCCPAKHATPSHVSCGGKHA